ncbi:MAG: DEAD/DEAH box helicase [Actinomycetota bacterium]|nr:DEAD/DEAH box helicase [Actinomycetota bacterium]
MSRSLASVAPPIVHTARDLAARLGLPEPTAEQAVVIESPLEPAVVIAGAGSGKTETMAARVVWLVANRLVAPDQVLGLTFTRKAAAGLGRRIRKRLAQWRHVVERELPDEHYLALLRAGEPTVLTYAAYAGRLVGEHAMRLGVEPDARLLSPAVAWQIADTAVRGYRDALPLDIGAPSSLVDYVLAMAAQFADHLTDIDTVEQFCREHLCAFEALPLGKGVRSERPGLTADLIRSLEHRLALLPLVHDFAIAKHRIPAVDFGDQMRVAAELASIEQVRAVERERYAAVLLDEYQDTGHAQIAMLHGLFRGGHPVTAVGDPFQSIYGWRGASAGNIGVFDRLFRRVDGTPAAVHPLAVSFRNDRAILEVANAVARPLQAGAFAVALRPHAGAGPGEVALARTETVEDEARWVAARTRDAWDRLPAGERTAAVLVRRRTQIPLLAEALQGAGLPVEIVGLGGLLTTPEIVDVVATLRVIADHKPGRSLMRLLTGARWRIGPGDLVALRDRAAWLVRPVEGAVVDDREPLSLTEALDDLGSPDRFSAEGYRRLSTLSAELRRLRRRASAPLGELVAEVEQTIGVGIEVAARPDRAAVGRAHLDRFLDEAARYATESEESTLRAFLAYLDAAEDEENGLEAGEVVIEPERVQVLTVHGAKGLEWDLVAVPGLVAEVFPAKAQGLNWTKTRQELPAPLRGDAADLPTFVIAGAADRRDVRDRLTAHHEQLLERHAQEERRLAYVAFTRARHTLLACGYVWDSTKAPRTPSPFLDELRTYVAADEWFEPQPDAGNPLVAQAATQLWPFDPLGPRGPGQGRRADVQAGAAMVRAAGQQLPLGAPTRGTGAATNDSPESQWHHDVEALLAERATLRRDVAIEVALPRQLSVTQLVELERDPDELARLLRRPLPRQPAPWARRGTAFHAWLEQRWQVQALLDVDELPGSADAEADDSEFAVLRAAFERSEWAARTPAAVEVPFDMAIAGSVIRGRMDAVFGNAHDGWLIVDWKTGARPVGSAADAAAIQLAAYRLAWARLNGIDDADLGQVRAAFHYVRSGETVSPADLQDAAGLRALLTGEAEHS